MKIRIPTSLLIVIFQTMKRLKLLHDDFFVSMSRLCIVLWFLSYEQKTYKLRHPFYINFIHEMGIHLIFKSYQIHPFLSGLTLITHTNHFIGKIILQFSKAPKKKISKYIKLINYLQQFNTLIILIHFITITIMLLCQKIKKGKFESSTFYILNSHLCYISYMQNEESKFI